jgi:ribosomal protein L11 methyltransferase
VSAGAAGWTTVRVRPSTGEDDAIAAALFEAGAQGVQFERGAVITHFPPEADLAGVRAAVWGVDAEAEIAESPADATDWTEAWKGLIRRHELGGLTVAPPWLAEGADPARTIVIEPGMAFGTGEHPTTRGVVRLMQGVVRPGMLVADLGAGSAVLSIAAVKLGAERAVAIEMDPEAIGNAEENVVGNGVRGRVQVVEGDAHLLLPLVAPVDLVLANIISSVLAGLLPTIADALPPGGPAILSGILHEERDAMLAVLGLGGWTLEREDVEEVWWSALIRRP